MTRRRLTRRITGIALGTCVWTTPGVADACHDVPVCVEWAVQLSDGDWGDYTTQWNIPARGARIRVLRPPPEPPLSMFLDAEGCGSFETQYAAGHKIIVHAEAALGPTRNIHVKAYPSGTAADADNDNLNWWAFHVPTIGDDKQIDILVPVDSLGITSQIAAATEAVHRLTSLSGNLLTQPLLLQIVHRGTIGSRLCEPQRICLGLTGRDEKFLLGHEIGHWIQQSIAGSWLEGADFDYVAQDDDCQQPLDPLELAEHFMPGATTSHAIRSAETSRFAMTEGFAHFISSAAFNDIAAGTDKDFRYYKKLDGAANNGAYSTFVDPEGDNYVVSLAGGTDTTTIGGRSRWAELECSADFDDNVAGDVTSEIDWLRFYWQFLTDTGTKPTFWDVVDIVTFSQTDIGWDVADVWVPLTDAVADPQFSDFEQRFLDLEPPNGVYDDP